MISITILPKLATKYNQNFKIVMTIYFWNSPKSTHSFRSKKMSNEDIETYLGSQTNKSNNYILGMDFVLLRESAPYISISLTNVTNKSLKSVSLGRTGRTPE